MFGALPKLLDPMRRAKANREGCLCLGPIFDLAQVRSVDMYAEQRVSPAPNAERQHCEALVELIEQAIAIDPQHSNAQVNLAGLYLNHKPKRPQAAKRLLSDVLERVPDHPGARYTLENHEAFTGKKYEPPPPLPPPPPGAGNSASASAVATIASTVPTNARRSLPRGDQNATAASPTRSPSSSAGPGGS